MYLSAQLQYVQLLYPLLPGPAESVAGVQTRRRTASLATGEPVTRPEIGSLRIPDGVPEAGRRSKIIDPGVVPETVARPRECAEATHHTKYALFPCTPCVLPIQNKLPYSAQKKSLMERCVLEDPHRRRKSLVIQIPDWHPSITSFKSRLPKNRVST